MKTLLLENKTFLFVLTFLLPLKQAASGEGTCLHPVILPEIFANYKNLVKALLKRESRGPEYHLRQYKKYDFLINRQVCRLRHPYLAV